MYIWSKMAKFNYWYFFMSYYNPPPPLKYYAYLQYMYE